MNRCAPVWTGFCSSFGHSSPRLYGLDNRSSSGKAIPIAEFNDVAQKAGLTVTNVFGEKHSTVYILESTGTGVAIFDYDNDGCPIFSS